MQLNVKSWYGIKINLFKIIILEDHQYIKLTTKNVDKYQSNLRKFNALNLQLIQMNLSIKHFTISLFSIWIFVSINDIEFTLYLNNYSLSIDFSLLI